MAGCRQEGEPGSNLQLHQGGTCVGYAAAHALDRSSYLGGTTSTNLGCMNNIAGRESRRSHMHQPMYLWPSKPMKNVFSTMCPPWIPSAVDAAQSLATGRAQSAADSSPTRVLRGNYQAYISPRCSFYRDLGPCLIFCGLIFCELRKIARTQIDDEMYVSSRLGVKACIHSGCSEQQLFTTDPFA